jgi:hypothetical protein
LDTIQPGNNLPEYQSIFHNTVLFLTDNNKLLYYILPSIHRLHWFTDSSFYMLLTWNKFQNSTYKNVHINLALLLKIKFACTFIF